MIHVKSQPWISLPARCDIAVAHDASPIQARVCAQYGYYQIREDSVLDLCVIVVIRALELDPDGEIVALLAPLETRSTRVPCATMERHELDQFATPLDQCMR